MKNIRLSHPTKELKGTVQLTPSKSESNRALIMRALAGDNKNNIENLSDCEDTKYVLEALASEQSELNVGNAGTAMRFLTAFYAISKEVKTITGNSRMCERPLRGLVEALRHLGAKIDFTEKEGFPPVKITGTELFGNEVNVEGSTSSQFVSALLMIGPMLPKGLRMQIEGQITSKPYILMTLGLMHHYGADARWENNTIIVKPTGYKPVDFSVENDWSAASYWYSAVALSKKADLILPGLKRRSYQGDEMIANIMEGMGVKTEFTDEGVRLTRIPVVTKHLTIDCSPFPDLAPTLAVTCAALGIEADISGLNTLPIKETDRLSALKNEMEKLGHTVRVYDDSIMRISGFGHVNGSIFNINTYGDHRIAMAFAPLAMVYSGIVIIDADVVNKSYPAFWSDLKSTGFQLEEVATKVS